MGGHVTGGFYDALVPVLAEHYAAKLAADEALATLDKLLPAAAVLNANVVVAKLKKRRAPRKRAVRPTPAPISATS